MPVQNNEKKNAVISLIIMSAGVLSAVLPFLLHTDLADWEFAVIFVGIVTAITAFFIFLMYNGRAKVQEKILSCEDILAHFYYPKEFWDRVSQEDMKDSGIGKIVGFFLGGIFALIGLTVFIIDTEENLLFLLIMAGIAVFFVIIGFISSAAEKKRITNSLPEAVIAKEGLYYKNTLYTWNDKKFCRLVSVTYHPADSDFLVFGLRRLSGNRMIITRYYPLFIQIPVPNGQAQAAYDIVTYFNIPMPLEQWNKMHQAENQNTDE